MVEVETTGATSHNSGLASGATAIEHGLVSTVIPVFNRPAMLRSAVASVLAQTYRPIEILISDDGSNDATASVGLELVQENPGIVQFIRNANRGPGPAREAGRRLARGEFIQYLDSDDRLLPRKFELQVAALRARPDCGIAYGYTRLVDAQGAELVAPFKWTGREIDTLFPGLLVDRWWCTHTPLYRRSVTDAVGPWTDLRYSQDWEYDARAGALGVRLVNCHEYVSDHCKHEGTRQTGGGQWLSPRERVRFFASILANSQIAGVDSQSSEAQHFSRWAFRHARECGAGGDARAAEDLLVISAKAIEHRSFELRSFKMLARVLGWRAATRLIESIRVILRRGAGPHTQRQSWMS